LSISCGLAVGTLLQPTEPRSHAKLGNPLKNSHPGIQAKYLPISKEKATEASFRGLDISNNYILSRNDAVGLSPKL
jgi:hypothetical protein